MPPFKNQQVCDCGHARTTHRKGFWDIHNEPQNWYYAKCRGKNCGCYIFKVKVSGVLGAELLEKAKTSEEIVSLVEKEEHIELQYRKNSRKLWLPLEAVQEEQARIRKAIEKVVWSADMTADTEGERELIKHKFQKAINKIFEENFGGQRNE